MQIDSVNSIAKQETTERLAREKGKAVKVNSSNRIRVRGVDKEEDELWKGNIVARSSETKEVGKLNTYNRQ